uniref:ZP domain-containing protein n=1 Tax=Heterorhabditis bacteriophora TaxID=37862 RepID=A0A1I7WPB5_HETBA
MLIGVWNIDLANLTVCNSMWQFQSIISITFILKTKNFLEFCQSQHHCFTSGDPIIKCLPDGLSAFINMTQPFSGHIYLRGYHGQKGCHANFRSKAVEKITTHFRFDDCPMKRKRQRNQLGVIVSGVIVVAHHPVLITYKDRATKPPSSLQVEHFRLPTCVYKVEVGKNIGQVNESSLVQVGDMAKLTLFRCSTYPDLLSPIVYSSAFRAHANSRVFKFADKSNITFSCQVQLSVKSGTFCPIPQCSFRNKRSTNTSSDWVVNYNIVAPSLTVIEKEEIKLHDESIPKQSLVSLTISSWHMIPVLLSINLLWDL